MKFGTQNADLELDDIHVTKYDFFKFMSAMLKIGFWPSLSQQPIARFQWDFMWRNNVLQKFGNEQIATTQCK